MSERKTIGSVEALLLIIEEHVAKHPSISYTLRWREPGRGVQKRAFDADDDYPVSIANAIRYAVIEVSVASLPRRVTFRLSSGDGRSLFATQVGGEGEFQLLVPAEGEKPEEA